VGIVSYSTWSIKEASEVKDEVRIHELTPMQSLHQVISTNRISAAAEKYIIKKESI